MYADVVNKIVASVFFTFLVNVDRYREMTEKVRFSNKTGTVALSPSVIAANAVAQRYLAHVLVLRGCPLLVNSLMAMVAYVQPLLFELRSKCRDSINSCPFGVDYMPPE